MKFEHVLILHSAKSKNKRVAYHKLIKEVSDYNIVLEKQRILKDKFPNVISFSIHFIETNSKDIESIEMEDSFFDGIEYIENFNDFKDLIEKDLTFNVEDLIKLALLEKSYSKLYLQNIMFLIAQKYMQTYKVKLIDEDFHAYKHGPILKSILNKFDFAGKQEIESLTSKDNLMLITRISEMGLRDTLLPISSAITKKCYSMTKAELYELGHKKSEPWHTTYHDSDNDIIPNSSMMV